MRLNKESKIYIFLKKNLSHKAKHYFYLIMYLYNNIRIKIPKFIFKYLITNIYDENNNKIFTLRNFGGSTISRGFTMFKSQKEVPKWIDSFKENSVFIDIGANIGLFSLYAAKKKHKVIALEPEALNFACLNLNIVDNNFNDKISAFPVALNNETKIAHLNMSKIGFGGSGSTFDRNINDHGKSFKSIYSQGAVSFTLDDLLEEISIVPNYIKIDVDGNELKVIQGMKSTLKNENLRSLCIELHVDFHEHAEVFRILNENFSKYKKHVWYENQNIFNYTFYRKIS